MIPSKKHTCDPFLQKKWVTTTDTFSQCTSNRYFSRVTIIIRNDKIVFLLYDIVYRVCLQGKGIEFLWDHRYDATNLSPNLGSLHISMPRILRKDDPFWHLSWWDSFRYPFNQFLSQVPCNDEIEDEIEIYY